MYPPRLATYLGWSSHKVNMFWYQISLPSSLESFFQFGDLLIVQSWRFTLTLNPKPSTSFGQTGFEGSQLEYFIDISLLKMKGLKDKYYVSGKPSFWIWERWVQVRMAGGCEVHTAVLNEETHDFHKCHRKLFFF